MIKNLITKHECRRCGNIITEIRNIVVDEYLENIKIINPKKCICGETKNFILIDIILEDYVYVQRKKNK